MGFLCQLINGSLPPGNQITLASSDNWTRQARSGGRQLARLLALLPQQKLDIAEAQVKAIQQLLATRLSTLDSLLAVSAQVSHQHLSAFTLILTEIHKLAEHNYIDAGELHESFGRLLRLLTSFNHEEI